MHLPTVSSLICYTAASLGGLFSFVLPFTSHGRTAPHWIRVALWLVGSIAVLWSALGWTLLLGATSLSHFSNFLLRLLKPFLGGMCTGIIILLFASGEFVRAFSGTRSDSTK